MRNGSQSTTNKKKLELDAPDDTRHKEQFVHKEDHNKKNLFQRATREGRKKV